MTRLLDLEKLKELTIDETNLTGKNAKITNNKLVYYNDNKEQDVTPEMIGAASNKNITKIYTNKVATFLPDNTYVDYLYCGTVEIEGLTENNVLDVILAESEAVSGKYSPFVISHNGYFNIYANLDKEITIPTIIVFSSEGIV